MTGVKNKINAYHNTKKTILVLGMILLPQLFFGQLINSVSIPEYVWALRHPFKAPKAFKVSQHTMHLVDSVVKTDSLKNPGDGHADALRHTLWMALLTKEMDSATAISLGIAHEKSGIREHKKGSFVHDSTAMEMDYYNNFIGVQVGLQADSLTTHQIIDSLIWMIENGYMLVIKRNEKGDFVDCNSQVIPWPPEQRLWNTKRCLVPSSENIDRY